MPAFPGMTVNGGSALGRLTLADEFSRPVVTELVDHAAALGAGVRAFGRGRRKLAERRRGDNDYRAGAPAARIRERIGRIPEASNRKTRLCSRTSRCGSSDCLNSGRARPTRNGRRRPRPDLGHDHGRSPSAWPATRAILVRERARLRGRTKGRERPRPTRKPPSSGGKFAWENISGAATASLAAKRPRSRWPIGPRA